MEVSMVRQAILSALLMSTASTLVVGQARSDFTGTWQCDEKRSTLCPAATVVVTQTNETLSLATPRGKAFSQTYRLDGRETVLDAVEDTTGRKLPAISATTEWDGSSLVMNLRTLDEPPIESRSVWRLSADGNEWTVETTQLSGGGRIIKHVYVKTGS
jgi:hypothetical protein